MGHLVCFKGFLAPLSEVETGGFGIKEGKELVQKDFKGFFTFLGQGMGLVVEDARKCYYFSSGLVVEGDLVSQVGFDGLERDYGALEGL